MLPPITDVIPATLRRHRQTKCTNLGGRRSGKDQPIACRSQNSKGWCSVIEISSSTLHQVCASELCETDRGETEQILDDYLTEEWKNLYLRSCKRN